MANKEDGPDRDLIDTDAGIESLRREPGSERWRGHVLRHLLVDRVTGLEGRAAANLHALRAVERFMGSAFWRHCQGPERVGLEYLQAFRASVSGPVAVVLKIHRFSDLQETLGAGVDPLLKAAASAMQGAMVGGTREEILQPIDLARAEAQIDFGTSGGIYRTRDDDGRFLMIFARTSRDQVIKEVIPEVDRIFGEVVKVMDPEVFLGVLPKLISTTIPLIEAGWYAGGLTGKTAAEDVLRIWTSMSDVMMRELECRGLLSALVKVASNHQVFDLLANGLSARTLHLSAADLRYAVLPLIPAQVLNDGGRQRRGLMIKTTRGLVVRPWLASANARLALLPEGQRAHLQELADLVRWIYGED